MGLRSLVDRPLRGWFLSILLPGVPISGFNVSPLHPHSPQILLILRDCLFLLLSPSPFCILFKYVKDNYNFMFLESFFSPAHVCGTRLNILLARELEILSYKFMIEDESSWRGLKDMPIGDWWGSMAGREGCSSGKAGLTDTLWGAGTFLVPRGSGSLWYQEGGYLLSACFLKCEMGAFASQQTVVFSPRPAHSPFLGLHALSILVSPHFFLTKL